MAVCCARRCCTEAPDCSSDAMRKGLPQIILRQALLFEILSGLRNNRHQIRQM